jgi:23S rRNA (cytidine1920-2'-O)/16S rRNA (cytidine1409-2'-O)-methyltransferase
MSAGGRIRLDEALVLRGLAPSRSRARDMILRATVSVDGETEAKPARMVASAQAISISDPGAAYVSRAALKLIAGLDAFGFDAAGQTVLDIGASTGGFTQVLLERGATHVIAIDVGHGEMDATLVSDPRVTLVERLNARDLQRMHLGRLAISAVVADLSFISLRLALPPALHLAEPGAWGVFLVKPQFEAGPKALGKGGVVRDPAVATKAADDIATWLGGELGWGVAGLLPSPISGGSGNQEFLLAARKDGLKNG